LTWIPADRSHHSTCRHTCLSHWACGHCSPAQRLARPRGTSSETPLGPNPAGCKSEHRLTCEPHSWGAEHQHVRDPSLCQERPASKCKNAHSASQSHPGRLRQQSEERSADQMVQQSLGYCACDQYSLELARWYWRQNACAPVVALHSSHEREPGAVIGSRRP